jgi:hypothetical protein
VRWQLSAKIGWLGAIGRWLGERTLSPTRWFECRAWTCPWLIGRVCQGRDSHTKRVGDNAPHLESVAAKFFVTSDNLSGFQGIKHLSVMKAFPALAFVAALFAFVLFPLRFEIAGSILFAAGFVAIAFCDYSRGSRPLRVRASVAVTASRKERFGLAAWQGWLVHWRRPLRASVGAVSF